MKRILILLLALMPFVAKAQGLQIDNEYKVVTWSKVCETDMTHDEILQQILAYKYLDNVVTLGNMIAGDIPPVYLNYKAAGYSHMKVALYLSNYKFTGRVIIRTKEGKYRAEVVAMHFEGTPLYEGVGEFAFDITAKLVANHLEKITTFYPVDKEWK